MRAARGYTLVELLTVVTIISLLIAIVVPSMATVRHIMKETSCLANLHAIGAAIQTYARRNQGRPDDPAAQRLSVRPGLR